MTIEQEKIEKDYQNRIKKVLDNDKDLQAVISERDELEESLRNMKAELVDLENREKELVKERDNLKQNIAGLTLIQGAARLGELKHELEAIAEVKEAAHKQLSGSSDIQGGIDNASRAVARCAEIAIKELREFEQKKVDMLRQSVLDHLKCSGSYLILQFR